VARQALTVIFAGLAMGAPVAWIAARLGSRQLTSLLFDLSPTDPPTVIAASVTLVIVAACAGLIPAHRASRIDPVVALRTE
jgi:ABC-type antimicrobial peptide transport system permease subunit